MSSNAPLLSGTIEADDDTPNLPRGNIGTSTQKTRDPIVLVPGTQANGSVQGISGGNVEEGGIVCSFRVSLWS